MITGPAGAGAEAGFLGEGRVTGGAKAAENDGLGLAFEGVSALLLEGEAALGVKEKEPVDFLGWLTGPGTCVPTSGGGGG